MAKNRKARRALESVKSKYMEATGAETRPFTLPDGEEVADLVVIPFDAFGSEWFMPHPMFAPDAWKEAVDQSDSESEKARAILGEEQFEKFAAAGGTSSDVMLMWVDVSATLQDDIRDAQGKSGPTRS
jgi:hypothetical protein